MPLAVGELLGDKMPFAQDRSTAASIVVRAVSSRMLVRYNCPDAAINATLGFVEGCLVLAIGNAELRTCVRPSNN
ncbi:hypothetical protein [Modicisalibacter luteus]|uniref:Uncharacterized protein n=1 Tax=Modicisalibacter luteus TaxID=453962 RepID=A0ABV7M583_9GAMM|nr:hypothetical protein [Halomonas lutea]GHB13691.1 hypothetical protein GCM10007159_40110 [Halomonas lutea]